MRLTSWVNTHPFQLSNCAANQRQKGSYHAKSTLISRSSSRGILMSRVVPFSSACCFTPNQTIRCLHITPQLQKCSPRNQAQEREASVTLPPSNSIMYRNLLFKWRCRIRWRERWHRSWFGSRRESMHKQRCKEYRVFEDATWSYQEISLVLASWMMLTPWWVYCDKCTELYTDAFDIWRAIRVSGWYLVNTITKSACCFGY